MQLDEWLERKKVETGLTRQDFAEKIGVTPQAITGYCDGSFQPRKAVMRRIREETLGAVTANDFFYAEPSAENAA